MGRLTMSSWRGPCLAVPKEGRFNIGAGRGQGFFNNLQDCQRRRVVQKIVPLLLSVSHRPVRRIFCVLLVHNPGRLPDRILDVLLE